MKLTENEKTIKKRSTKFMSKLFFLRDTCRQKLIEITRSLNKRKLQGFDVIRYAVLKNII